MSALMDDSEGKERRYERCERNRSSSIIPGSGSPLQSPPPALLGLSEEVLVQIGSLMMQNLLVLCVCEQHKRHEEMVFSNLPLVRAALLLLQLQSF